MQIKEVLLLARLSALTSNSGISDGPEETLHKAFHSKALNSGQDIFGEEGTGSFFYIAQRSLMYPFYFR